MVCSVRIYIAQNNTALKLNVCEREREKRKPGAHICAALLKTNGEFVLGKW